MVTGVSSAEKGRHHWLFQKTMKIPRRGNNWEMLQRENKIHGSYFHTLCNCK
jgi:hypothetical protein